jgi:CheY-like chemotaxis protein
MKKPTLLLIASDAGYLDSVKSGYERDYDVVPAMLHASLATAECPSAFEVVKVCQRTGRQLDGVVIVDPSFHPSHPHVQSMHLMHQWSDERQRAVLKNMDALSVPAGDDPVGAAAVEEKLKDAAHGCAQLYERGKNTTEEILFNMRPNENTATLIRALRQDGSRYRDTPVVVAFAQPDRKKEFADAGANAVLTMRDVDDIAGRRVMRNLVPPDKDYGRPAERA